MRLHIHRWRIQFPALYGHPRAHGYGACRCGSRRVTGPDAYSDYAWPWIQDGTAPPESRWPWRQGQVTVTLRADTSGFDRELEKVQEFTYRRRIEHERSLGRAYVGHRLDQLCRDLGLDPVEAWRFPKWLDEQARRDRAMLHAGWRAGIQVQAPQQITWSGGVA